MPQPEPENPFGLTRADVYDNARYEAGYRMGWRDSHRRKLPAHRTTRAKYAEYEAGYADGWVDGSTKPDMPEWPESWRGRRTTPVGTA